MWIRLLFQFADVVYMMCLLKRMVVFLLPVNANNKEIGFQSD
jgi:hypothetical protein